MSAKSADWQFPPRNGGIDFVQDPSSAHFSDAPMPKLVREVIQNSLDARENGIYEPVVVKFRSTQINRQLIGATQLYKHLTACLDRAKAENHPASLIRFYENACKTLRAKKVLCLSITDSRTTGLSDSRWNALVVQEGAVQKSSGGAPGGSYGIGKNAVFNVSDIRTVFYSTRYVNGREGRVEKMQGKATLMSHPNPDNGTDALQHIGFYAAQNREPLVTTEIDDFFRLDEPGAGVFVMGFNPRSSNWMKGVASAVVENFFDAIHKKTLVVEIYSDDVDDAESITVDHETIDQLFEGLFSKKPDAFYYYKAIRDAERMPTPDIDKAGVLNAQVLIDSGAPRRTAYVNRNGMLITASREQKDNPIAPRGKSLWPDYAAVVTPATDEGDTWIRSMENPSHDSISSDQLLEAKQQRQANKIFADARRELREIIDKKADISKYGDTSNLDELQRYFPELDPTAEGNRKLGVKTIPSKPNPSPTAPLRFPDPAPRPDPDPRPNPDPHPQPNPNPKPPGPPMPGPLRRAAINSVRYIPIKQTEAIISFTPDNITDEIKLTLTPTGGERREKEEPLQIIDATALSPDNPKISLAEGVLSLKPNENKRMTIKIVTNNPLGNFAVKVG